MIYKKIHTEDTDILIWEITESVTELAHQIQNFERYQVDFDKLTSTKRKQEFLAARLAFQELVGTTETIVYNDEGKPHCDSKKFNLSITHTQKWVAVFIHSNCEVGIDMEAPNERFKKLYKRFLNITEQQYLTNSDNMQKVELAWSAKETLYKIIGKQAVDFATQLEIRDFEPAPIGQFEGIHRPTGQIFKLNYQVLDHFNLVYCIKK